MPMLEVLDRPVEEGETIDARLARPARAEPRSQDGAAPARLVGLPYNEIADSLEITLATVKWRIFKAREEVQLALAREGITFGDSAEAPAVLST